MTRTYPMLALVALALAGCARPNIQIDASAIEKEAGALPVGLLEVHRANSGTFGLSIGEDIKESLFCTASLLDDGRLLTSSACLGDSQRRFERSDLEFHLNRPGSTETEHFSVSGVETDPSRPELAYLRVEGMPELRRTKAFAIDDSQLRLDQNDPNLKARTVAISTPNEDGLAIGRIVNSTVEYSADGFAFPSDAEPQDNNDDDRARRREQRRREREQRNGQRGGAGPNSPFGPNRPDDDSYDRNRDLDREREDERRDEDERRRRERRQRRYGNVRAQGTRGATAGSVVLVDGRIVGIIKKQGAAADAGEVFWLDHSGNARDDERRTDRPREPRREAARTEELPVPMRPGEIRSPRLDR